ncbi:cytochrome C assembly family protein [Candidatus Magnetaquicoccus inordinatus]|uniref:cytochrome C assembly family protein n=1 Tax=Candidatus Magnetaquicoccus inordinatus TaxID=2496818 RepID=UPI00102BF35F|nr:cytochrome c biogenesis protein CcsA [Candidatus Magnetaquicoccus inordinatus]
MKEIFIWGAVGFYATAAVWILYVHLRGIERPSLLSWWLVLLGWLVQLFPLVRVWVDAHGALDLQLRTLLEMSTLAMGGIYLLWWRLRPQAARTVGVLLLPLMVLTLLASLWLPVVQAHLQSLSDPLLLGHLLLSLMAYGLFSIAAMLALMDAFQEHALRTKRFGELFTLLPPLDALEETLFLMVNMGFVLLTASMLTGGWYSYNERGSALFLNHKQVFTWATWLVYGALLLGRHFQGWRGRRAVRLTLWGYLFLALAFLGVKFVTQIVLGR